MIITSHGQSISTRQLGPFDPIKREFACDESNLGRGAFHQVFDDACDVGFTLVSHVTGEVMVMVAVESKYSPDGELLWTVYRPADRSHRNLFIVRLFND